MIHERSCKAKDTQALDSPFCHPTKKSCKIPGAVLELLHMKPFPSLPGIELIFQHL